MNHEPSLFIPCIDDNVSNAQIRNVISLFGDVKRIRTVKTFRSNVINDENVYKHVVVHFKQWRTSVNVQNMRSELLRGNSIKMVHNFALYWKIYQNKTCKKR